MPVKVAQHSMCQALGQLSGTSPTVKTHMQTLMQSGPEHNWVFDLAHSEHSQEDFTKLRESWQNNNKY